MSGSVRPLVLQMQKYKELFAKSFENWSEDNASRLAAAFSFYAVLSLAPLLVLAVAIATMVLADVDVRERLLNQAGAYVGENGADFLGTLIENSNKPGFTTWASVLALLVAIYGASNLFAQLSMSVNTIWDLPPSVEGVKGVIVRQIKGIAMFLVFAALFIGWMGLDSWLGWLERHSSGFQGWQVVSLIATVVFLTLVFAISFKALPRNQVRWRDVWPGAIFTALGFAAAKYLLSLYFAYSGVAAIYGSAGALVVILLWIYYTSMVYFFGIEITYVYAHTHGSHKAEDLKTEKPAEERQNKAYPA